MADENLDMESVRISELEQTTEVDREKDYLVVSRHSDAYIDDEKSFKITPDDLLDGVGVNYNAGAHIAIDNNTHTISATYTNATTSADGLMSKEDKSTVDSLQPVATSGDYNDLTNKPTIPAAQVNSDWNSNSGVSEILNKPTLATVATTGDYNDLSNTPIIPAAQVNSDWNSNSGLSQILNKPQLSAVATSGNYTDLSNTPTIPEDLAGLGDVDITSTSLSDNQVLKYDANSGKWINSTGGGGGGASDLNELDDVTITSPEENQVLKYNGTQWVNATSPAGATTLDGLTDVTIASPTPGQALVYDGNSGEWKNGVIDYSNITNTPTIPAAQVNADWNSTSGVSEILNKPTIPTVNDATITVVQGSTTKGTFTLNQGTDATITLDAGGSGGVSALDDLTDVDITNPTANQVLKYDGTSWVNGTGGGGDADVIKTASGNPCSFSTSFAGKLKSLTAEIVASGGNGTPSNPIPIVGHTELNLTRCGVNFFNASADNITEGSNICTISENVITNTGANAYDAVRFEQSLPSGSYVIHASNISTNGIIQVSYYDGSYQDLGYLLSNNTTLQFTVPTVATKVRISLYSSQAGGMSVTDLQCELGSTPSAYEPYNGQTFTVAFGQTVYGGVYDKSGRLTITMTQAIDLSTLTWNWQSSWESWYSYELSTQIKGALNNDTVPNIVAEKYQTVYLNKILTKSEDNCVGCSNNDSANKLIAIRNGSNSITPTGYLIIELATPIVIDVQAISPSAVVGTNNIVSDCGGDVSVQYFTDTASEIHELINDTVNIEELANVEINAPQDGDTIVYDSNNSKWVNGAGGGSAKQTTVTQAEYNALVQAGTVDPTMEYFITDGIPYQVFPWTELVATLTAGSTELVFTNSAITTNSTIDPYVDDSFSEVKPTAIVITNGSVTLTFNEQADDIPVKVRIS